MARTWRDGTYYVVVDPDGLVATYSFDVWKAGAIRAVLHALRHDWDDRGKSWRRLYREGWRLHKVRIMPA